MRYTADKVIANHDMSGSVTSEALDVRLQYGFTIFAVASGAAAGGTIKVQASPDGTTWADIGVSNTFTGTGTWLSNQQWQFYPYVRLVYTTAGGSVGTLNVWFTAKGG